MMKLWNEIIIHHSLTKDTETVSWGAIRRYHTQELRWLDIGYHWGIERVGSQYEILKGRSMNWRGAHTLGRNSRAIGVCCVGNYDEVEPPKQLLLKLKHLVAWLGEIYDIPQGHLFGHRDFSAKTCPGERFEINSEWLRA